ncbi:MAG: Gfo/Idh/MocA family oxidoreductase [Planctomycetales bacterium]|nr:Gfo/Idh/MocA family oxidoreductase [Planctomycetales bacterium]
MQRSTRRSFLKTSSMLGSGLVLAGTQASRPVWGANERLRIGVIGLNGRGKNHIDGWLGQSNVELAWLVDPDQKVLDKTLKLVADKTNGSHHPQGVRDVRRALEDKNLDAISVATPNHWHSLITIWGAQAGKHVYVEKPMSHDVVEGRICVEAQKKYGVVIQHGTQSRSNAKIAGLHAAIHAGKFGKLKIAYGYCCKPRGSIGDKPTGSPPSELDWNLWRGPAQLEDFHGNYVHYNWHWFWKTGNGDMNNQGTHQLDIARWAIDPDQTHPTRVMALGGRFQWNDQGETPNTMFAVAEYPNGQQVFFNVRNVDYDGYQRQVTNEYYFEDGGYISDNRYFAKGSKNGEPLQISDGPVTPGGNWAAFVAACRANDPSMANGNVVDAHYASVLGHLMNNSYRLGEDLPFNSQAGRFGDNAEAVEHFGRLHAIMSRGVGIPAEGNHYTVGPWLTFNPDAEQHTGPNAEAANRLLKDSNRKGFEVPTIKTV